MTFFFAISKKNESSADQSPRELIHRCRDICELRQQPFTLSTEIMNLAWVAFFGIDGASAV